VNAAIAGLRDPRTTIREHWGSLEECNRDGGPYAPNVTPILHKNTAARWAKAAMKISNPTLFCVVYCGQQADGTDGAQMPVHGGYSYLPLDDFLPPAAKDTIDDIGEVSDHDGEMWRPNPSPDPITKTGFQKFEWKH